MNRSEELKLRQKARELILEDLKANVKEIDEIEDAYESDKKYKEYCINIDRVISIEKILQLEDIQSELSSIRNDFQENEIGTMLEKIVKNLDNLDNIRGACDNLVDCVGSKELLDAIKGKEY